jgi:CBS-domain-containing membrane protein
MARIFAQRGTAVFDKTVEIEYVVLRTILWWIRSIDQLRMLLSLSRVLCQDLIQINGRSVAGCILGSTEDDGAWFLMTVLREGVSSMRAKDVMTENVISVSEASPIHEVVGLLLKYRISAVPVVDDARKVVGIISEGDLLRPEAASRTTMRRPWWLEAVSAGQTVPYEQAHGRTAGMVMTRNVVTVDEDTPLNEIARLLEHHHIKRVPVPSNGGLVGIVSRANLLHGLANTIIDHHEPSAAQDRQLRNELLRILLSKPELDGVLVNVTVADGNVRLWGVVENADEAAVAEDAAKVLPGVKSVENNLHPGPISGVPV